MDSLFFIIVTSFGGAKGGLKLIIYRPFLAFTSLVEIYC
jgi:hypothetical protein